MLKVYPAIFHKEDGYWVEFPDLEGCNTSGSTLENTMEMAQEALGLYLVSIMEDGNDLPVPSIIEDLNAPEDAIVSYVSTDIEKYRRNTRAVKKTLSLPEWLNEEAMAKGINFSSVLQDALKDRLGF